MRIHTLLSSVNAGRVSAGGEALAYSPRELGDRFFFNVLTAVPQQCLEQSFNARVLYLHPQCSVSLLISLLSCHLLTVCDSQSEEGDIGAGIQPGFMNADFPPVHGLPSCLTFSL